MAKQAMTFRTFFEGLASAMPQLSQTVYQWTMYNQQQQQMDRMYGLEERRTTAAEKESAAHVARSEMETDEIRTLLPIRKQMMEYEAIERQAAAELKSMELQGIQAAGGADYYRQYTELNLDKLKQALAESAQNIRTQAAQAELANLNAMTARMEFNRTMINLAHESVVDPTFIPKMDEIVAKAPRYDNGLINFDAVRAEAATQGIKMFTENQLKIINNLTNNLTMLDLEQYQGGIDAGKNFMGAVLSKAIEDGDKIDDKFLSEMVQSGNTISEVMSGGITINDIINNARMRIGLPPMQRFVDPRWNKPEQIYDAGVRRPPQGRRGTGGQSQDNLNPTEARLLFGPMGGAVNLGPIYSAGE